MARRRRGRGEGAIYQRADGLWAGSCSLGYDDHGKRKRRVVYGATKQEVQEKLRQLQTDHALGRLTDADKFTVADYLTLWLEQTARVKVSPTTYHRYRQHVRLHLIPHVGSVRLNKLTALHVGQLYSAMERAGASASECRKVGKVFKQALRDAVRLRFLMHNPAADVLMPRVIKKEITPLDQEQAVRLLTHAAEDRHHALYVLALDSGMRQGELFGLTWPDIDFGAGSVQVQRSLEEIQGHLRLKETKTGKGRRRIDLTPFTRDALHEHRKRMLAEGRDVKAGAVFCDTEGKWLRKSNFQRRSFKPLLRGAELPDIRFHDLRHTCATLLLMADVNVKVVSERLGHRSIEITLNTYSHVLPTMQKTAAEKMQGIFGHAAAAK